MDTSGERGSLLRALLILGRVSNLPTVWSNCLAGWLLTGEPLRTSFGLVLGGATCLYTGGMFLNDAWDAEFDQRHRADRPIPSGMISRTLVLTLAWVLFAAGTGLVALVGGPATLWTVALVAAIVLYDRLHKRWAPTLILMAVCRSLLYLLAAASAIGDIKAVVVPCVALGVYVLGISLVARFEAGNGKPSRWPLLLALIPLPVAAHLSAGDGLFSMILVCLAFLCWLLGSTYSSRRSGGGIPVLVGRLIAGMVLVDWMFVAAVRAPNWSSLAFALLLALALLLQRRVPAS